MIRGFGPGAGGLVLLGLGLAAAAPWGGAPAGGAPAGAGVLDGAGDPGRWEPLELGVYVPAGGAQIEAELTRIVDAFRALPALSSPIGFDVLPAGGAQVPSTPGGEEDAASPYWAQAFINLHEPRPPCDGCDRVYPTPAASFSVWANRVPDRFLVRYDRVFSDIDLLAQVHRLGDGELSIHRLGTDEDLWYFGAEPIGTRGGFAEFEFGVWITRDGRPALTPVSQQQYLVNAIAAERRDSAWVAADGLAVTCRGWWQAGVPYEGERCDRQLAQELAFRGRTIAALQAELLALSAAERAAPAYLLPVHRMPVPARDVGLTGTDLFHENGPFYNLFYVSGSGRASGLASPGTRITHRGSTLAARPVVRFDPAYYDATLPKSAFQMLVVQRTPNARPPELAARFARAWDELDWAALGGLVRR
jgi:hypothetical protein